MKAARYYGIKDVRIEEISIPKRPSDHLLLRVAWCGPLATPAPGKQDPITGDTLPVTLGHELCGRVVEVPENCPLEVGQAVMVDPRLYCSECSMCKQGDTNLCYKLGFVGLSGGGGGGFSEFVAVDPTRCYPIADSSLDTACLIEPLAVARHALRQSGFSEFRDKTSLILGAGPIGLAVIHNLKAVGTGPVFVSEPSSLRLEYARDIGVTGINPQESNLVDTIEQLTNGNGVDVVFDCAGFIPAMAPAMSSLRKKGKYVLVAVPTKPITLPPTEWYAREITVVASVAYNDVDFQEVVKDFNEGKFKGVERMVSRRIHLDQFVDQGLEALITSKDTLLKVLVEPK
ncbi:hypothetical protein GGP41_004940 [Bipolaris sorokiniana]|uniref:Enoyl reductase (ER) domain-containing protein n=1 Tax=Cochliobolus sativus TaxID=45130 RepID=A0A8H5ZA44_COCSA|nr:hypothetical protein GGP41_004940 [Bipolaris sorokiniana]